MRGLCSFVLLMIESDCDNNPLKFKTMKKLMLSIAMAMGLSVANSQNVYTSNMWRYMFHDVSIFNVWEVPYPATITVDKTGHNMTIQKQGATTVEIEIAAFTHRADGYSPKGYHYESYYYGASIGNESCNVVITYIKGDTFITLITGSGKTSFLLNEKVKITLPSLEEL